MRTVGPGLAAFGVADALADPTVTIFRDGVAIAAHDNGSPAVNSAEIAAGGNFGRCFSLSPRSRRRRTGHHLMPGACTAAVNGAGATTGTALVEIYSLP